MYFLKCFFDLLKMFLIVSIYKHLMFGLCLTPVLYIAPTIFTLFKLCVLWRVVLPNILTWSHLSKSSIQGLQNLKLCPRSFFVQIGGFYFGLQSDVGVILLEYYVWILATSLNSTVWWTSSCRKGQPYAFSSHKLQSHFIAYSTNKYLWNPQL